MFNSWRLSFVSYTAHRPVRTSPCVDKSYYLSITQKFDNENKKQMRMDENYNVVPLGTFLSPNLIEYCLASSVFDCIHMLIIWLGEVLLCDWLRTGQFIVHFSFAPQRKLTSTRSLMFSVISNYDLHFSDLGFRI